MKQKNFFKKLLLSLLFVAVFMATSISAQAQVRLYVYAQDGTEKSSFAVSNLKTITFTEQDMSFNAYDGNATTEPFDEVSVWIFKNGTSNIQQPSTLNNVKVYLNRSNVQVESSIEIASIQMYNTQGNLLQQTAPENLSATMPLSAYSAGLYILRVVGTNGQTSVHKIVKP